MSAPFEKAVEVELIRLVDEDVYLLETVPWGLKLEVDGMPVKAPCAVNDPASFVRVHPAAKELAHYARDTGAVLTPDVYQRLRAEHLANAGEDHEFSDLDLEYAFKKFEQTWHPVYRELPERREPVGYRVVEIRRNSGDSDIISLWNAPGLERQKHLYQVSRPGLTGKAFRELAAKHGLVVDLPTHSGLRFAKADGAYLFDDSMDFSRAGSFVGTLDQCKAEKARLLQLVSAPVLAAAAKKHGLVAGGAGELRQLLASARQTVAGLVLKSSAANNRGAAIKALDQALAMLDSQIAKELS